MNNSQTFIAALLVATYISMPVPVVAQSHGDIEALIDSWLQQRSVNDLAPNQSTIRSNLYTRLNQLQDRVQAERQSRQLTARELSNLTARLNRIENRLRSSDRDGAGLTVGETRKLLLDMREMTLALNRQSTDNDTGRDSRTVSAELTNLHNRVQKARRDNDITRRQASDLNSSLSWISSELKRMDNNGLSRAEERQIRNHIATVDSRLKSYAQLADNRNDLADEIRRVGRKLDHVQRTGRLSNAHAARLKRDLDYVRSLENRLARSGRGLTGDEERYIRGLLSAVERGVNLYM